MANRLGLSRVTVSYVLNGKGTQYRIPVSTQERIHACAKEQGYVPQWNSLSLKSKQDWDLGFLILGSLYSHHQEAFNLFCSHFQEHGLRNIIQTTARDRLVESIKMIRSLRVPALILMGDDKWNMPQLSLWQEALLFLAHMDVIFYDFPFGIFPEAPFLEAGIDLVGIDRKKAYASALDLLAKRNLTRMATLQSYAGLARHPLKAAYKEVQGSLNPALLLKIPPNTPSGTFQFGLKLFKINFNAIRKSKIDCVLLHDDREALGFCAGAEAFGLSIPGQLSVIGFDGIAEGQTRTPPLTSLRVPYQEMTETALQCLRQKRAAGIGRKYLFEVALLNKNHGTLKPGNLK
ncbi:MAG: LacI family DNA-binding transcriptional regulator [Fibrobacterota bacterium]